MTMFLMGFECEIRSNRVEMYRSSTYSVMRDPKYNFLQLSNYPGEMGAAVVLATTREFHTLIEHLNDLNDNE